MGSDHATWLKKHKKSKHSGGEASKKDRVTGTCKLRGTAEWEHAYRETKLRARAPLGKLWQRAPATTPNLRTLQTRNLTPPNFAMSKVQISNRYNFCSNFDNIPKF